MLLRTVGIVLRIAKGIEEGSELRFEKSEVKLGRTADNDVVVKDGAASRSHARVFLKNGTYWVEDLGSANGTKLNGKPVSGVQKLESEDTVEIGDTVYLFDAPEEEVESASSTVDESADDVSGGDTGDEDEGDPNSTMIRKTPMPRHALAKRSGARVPARRPADSLDNVNAGDSEEDLSDDELKSTGRFSADAPKSVAKSRGSGARDLPQPAPLSAADRLRERRQLEQSAGGKFVLAWRDMSGPVRAVVGLFGVGFFAAFMYVAVRVILPPDTGPARIEPETLQANAAPEDAHYGVGDGITFTRVDQKTFNFELAAATKMVGVLHYHAKNISQNEVSLTVNGTDLGFAPPDVVDNDSREIDRVIPVDVIKAQASNVLTFDNVLNPPRSETWDIWDVWIEVLPVPDLSVEETARRAKEQTDAAAKLYETKGLASANLFKAWKNYREAWLLLESTPNRPEALHQLALTRTKELRLELDNLCQKISVNVQRAFRLNKEKDGIAELKNVVSFFPTKEHPCHTRAKRTLAIEGDDLNKLENL